MANEKICPECGKPNGIDRYFCEKCGSFLDREMFHRKELYEREEVKIRRILENLEYTPHSQIVWNDMVDLYTKKVERYQALMNLPNETTENSSVAEKMKDFLRLCNKPEFQIAFVGTIKTGKSTLINALLGHNYASMAVTPETAALTKFRSSARDYVDVTFYSKQEWDQLWASRTSAADAFMNEYKELHAEQIKNQWVGHAPLRKEVANCDIEKELARWSSSKMAEHYFVKEIEVGISSLPIDFPKQVVLVDTPGLSDPVAYRSEITKNYIRKANAVFVCVDAQKVQKDEIETIASVFSFASHNKDKVHIIATHWDKLNKPIEEWKEQKEWLKKRLTGKGFFDDQKMAETNIIHSAAYIYNLCRDYDSSKDDYSINLVVFALQMKLDITNLSACIPQMKKLTNIESINRIVIDKFAKNYQTLLHKDIQNKYQDILHALKRDANEAKDSVKELLVATNDKREDIEKKIEIQKRNYEEILHSKEQLDVAMRSVSAYTQKRLDRLKSEMDKEMRRL